MLAASLWTSLASATLIPHVSSLSTNTYFFSMYYNCSLTFVDVLVGLSRIRTWSHVKWNNSPCSQDEQGKQFRRWAVSCLSLRSFSFNKCEAFADLQGGEEELPIMWSKQSLWMETLQLQGAFVNGEPDSNPTSCDQPDAKMWATVCQISSCLSKPRGKGSIRMSFYRPFKWTNWQCKAESDIRYLWWVGVRFSEWTNA